MASLGPSEHKKNEVGLSHVLQELSFWKQCAPGLSLHGCAPPLGLCLGTRSGAACAMANKRLPVCFIRKKLKWNEVIFHLKTQAKTTLPPDKVKSFPLLLLCLASPATQIWHKLGWAPRKSSFFPLPPRTDLWLCSWLRGGPLLLRVVSSSAVGWWGPCLLCLTACSLHYSDLSQEFASWFLLNSNLLSFQMIPASKCGASTVRLTCSLSPMPHHILLTSTANCEFTNGSSVHHSALSP